MFFQVSRGSKPAEKTLQIERKKRKNPENRKKRKKSIQKGKITVDTKIKKVLETEKGNKNLLKIEKLEVNNIQG